MSEKSLAVAKVIDGILVLSLPDAINPVVWQMELGQTKSSAMELRSESDNTFVLVLKTAHQDVQRVANYTNRELALAALMVISRALERAQGQINANFALTAAPTAQHNMYYAPPPSGGFKTVLKLLGKIIVWIVGLALLLLVANILLSAIFGSGKSQNNLATPSSITQKQNVPVSADDFLEGR